MEFLIILSIAFPVLAGAGLAIAAVSNREFAKDREVIHKYSRIVLAIVMVVTAVNNIVNI